MPIPTIESVEPLIGPYEILDLGLGGTRDLKITGFRVGRMKIHRRTDGVDKEIVALRVTVPEDIKPLYPDYYDITSQTLIAQVLPVIEQGGYEQKRFVITKYGSGPTARFSLTVKPE